MSSSSRSSRVCRQQPDLPIRPATDPIWSEEGYDDYEFGHVATWETALREKPGLTLGTLGIAGIGAMFSDDLKLDHEVNNKRVSQ